MLVVITILLVMMGVTVAVINVSAEGERIRSGASQVQSYLAGARDRAAFAGRPCGVRGLEGARGRGALNRDAAQAKAGACPPPPPAMINFSVLVFFTTKDPPPPPEE